MITIEDIDAFREDNAEALSQAHEFARRSRKGLPGDRLGSDRQLHLVAQGIWAMQAIMTLQTDMLAAFLGNYASEANGSE